MFFCGERNCNRITFSVNITVICSQEITVHAMVVTTGYLHTFCLVWLKSSEKGRDEKKKVKD